MKEYFNVMGYLSLVATPILLLLFLEYINAIRILILIMLLIIVIIEILHYKKTKIKHIGSRILMTFILIIISTKIVSFTYGKIKDIEVNKTLETIDRIERENGIITPEKLKNKLHFMTQKPFIKGSTDIVIYYKDGSVEESKYYQPDMIKIKNNNYYIDYFDFKFTNFNFNNIIFH